MYHVSQRQTNDAKKKKNNRKIARRYTHGMVVLQWHTTAGDIGIDTELAIRVANLAVHD